MPQYIRAGSNTLKVFESQDSFTYRVSLSSEAGNGAAPSRCVTCRTQRVS